MARKLDRILVVDIEATCWEGNPPPGQISEIIEIGLCVLDVSTLARVEQRDILVRPVCSTVSPDCTQLATLTQADVDGDVSLAEACQILANEYQAPARLWASYGDYDRKQFERNCPRRASSASRIRSARRTSTSRRWRLSPTAGRAKWG